MKMFTYAYHCTTAKKPRVMSGGLYCSQLYTVRFLLFIYSVSFSCTFHEHHHNNKKNVSVGNHVICNENSNEICFFNV